MIYDIIGYIAGITCTINLFPQIYIIYKRKSAEDISYCALTLLEISAILWIIYGYYIDSFQIIICDIILFILNGQIIIMKYYYKNIYENNQLNNI